MNVADLLVFLSAIAAGIVASVVTNWSLRARLYSLEDAVAVLQANLTREVKIRAGLERQRRPTKDEELLEAKIAVAQQASQPTRPWWQTGLPREFHG